jgi:hypothetical protein
MKTEFAILSKGYKNTPCKTQETSDFIEISERLGIRTRYPEFPQKKACNYSNLLKKLQKLE